MTIDMEENKAIDPSPDEDCQYLFIIRHGDRWDYANPEWRKLPNSRIGDSPLSPLGHQQAQEVGKYLDSWLDERNFKESDIKWYSSPFLRCLQTSDSALSAFRKVSMDHIKILPEYSIFEWDGHEGEWHKDLPSLEERKHYFPRLDTSYKSMYVPNLPEPRNKFFERCQNAIDCFHKQNPYKPRQVFVMVSHAAGCIALAKTLTKLNLTDITPAAPCSIFGFTRKSETDVWSIAAHDDLNGHNGYTGHLSDMSGATIPWNGFGDGVQKFYTGPPTSRFARKKE